MKECTYCGKEYDDTATACLIDGHPLAPITPPPPRPMIQDERSDVLAAQPERLFFPRQIGRVSFIVRYVLFMLAVWLGAFLLAMGATMKAGVPALTVLALSALLLLFALFYFIRHVLVARLRDVGVHNLFGLLIFVPIVNIVFLLALAFTPKDGFKR